MKTKPIADIQLHPMSEYPALLTNNTKRKDGNV